MKPNPNLVTWSATYSVGIKLIDDQHKELLNLVNDMYNHVNDDDEEAERTYFLGVIRHIVDYIKIHFATEEKIMQRTKFQGYAGHKRVHDTFILNVVDIIMKYDEGRRVSLIFFTNFVKDWILTHIAIMDKQYFEYLVRIVSRRANGKPNVNNIVIAC